MKKKSGQRIPGAEEEQELVVKKNCEQRYLMYRKSRTGAAKKTSGLRIT